LPESQPSQDAAVPIQIDPVAAHPDDLVFYLLGDWGELQSMKATAEAMNLWGEQNRKADFLLALGDNFYPNGVKSVDDPKFKKWEKVFLCHPNLRIPWRIILGNHDYQSNPQAQIDFTTSPKNPDGLWQLPSRNYQFTHCLPNGRSVEFFGIDTNGCQGHVRRQWPNTQQELHDYKPVLRELLNKSTATWKIVFAHHPLYTKGSEHGTLGRCLRSEVYSHRGGTSAGYGLEKLLSECGVSAYISGHEHMMEHHFAEGIHHFVVGATGNAGWYGGEDPTQNIDWYSARLGFAVCVVKDDQLNVKFVSKTGEEYYSVAIPPPVPKPQPLPEENNHSGEQTQKVEENDSNEPMVVEDDVLHDESKQLNEVASIPLPEGKL